jgi:light-independent protochlorophyllide reductase subunit B
LLVIVKISDPDGSTVFPQTMQVDYVRVWQKQTATPGDYLEVEAKVAELQPELVLGTQMERHIAKRLGIPCAVISAPVHVQDFPARHSPQTRF